MLIRLKGQRESETATPSPDPIALWDMSIGLQACLLISMIYYKMWKPSGNITQKGHRAHSLETWRRLVKTMNRTIVVAAILNPLGVCKWQLKAMFCHPLQVARPWIWTRRTPNPRGIILQYLHKVEWGLSSSNVGKFDHCNHPGPHAKTVIPLQSHDHQWCQMGIL